MDSSGRHVVVIEPLKGGGGASINQDGTAGTDSDGGFLRNTPVESIEAHVPVLVERYELLPDSAGAGRHRGGWGTCLEFRVELPDSIVTARGMERCRFEPWGLRGGQASIRTQAFVTDGQSGERRVVGRINVLQLGPGDVVSLWASGGAGYGDPLERELGLIEADIRSELLSPSQAETYGVVFSEDGQIDASATGARRTALAGHASTAAPLFDLGPSRREYERVWSDAQSSALVEFLMELPIGLRSFAKREIHLRIDSLGLEATQETMRAIWSDYEEKLRGFVHEVAPSVSAIVA